MPKIFFNRHKTIPQNRFSSAIFVVWIKLLDFGLENWVKEEEDTAGEVGGTPQLRRDTGHLSPTQWVSCVPSSLPQLAAACFKITSVASSIQAMQSHSRNNDAVGTKLQI